MLRARPQARAVAGRSSTVTTGPSYHVAQVALAVAVALRHPDARSTQDVRFVRHGMPPPARAQREDGTRDTHAATSADARGSSAPATAAAWGCPPLVRDAL